MLSFTAIYKCNWLLETQDTVHLLLEGVGGCAGSTTASCGLNVPCVHCVKITFSGRRHVC